LKREVLAVAAVAALHAALVLLGDPLRHPSVDSYCHASMAAEIARGAWAPRLSAALPWTIFASLDVDHYWGHHLLTAPFVGVLGQLAGLKVASGFFFLLVPVATCLVLQARGVPWAPLFALAPLLAPTQDWRYLQLRGGAWTVTLLLASMHVAFFSDSGAARRRSLLALLGYMAMLSYHGGVVLLVFHGGGVLWERWARGGWVRGRGVDLLCTAAGLVGGLVLNPYMDRQGAPLRFAWYHITRMGADTDRLYTDWKRAEFQPFPLELLRDQPLWLALLGALLGAALWVIARRLRGRPVEADTLQMAGLALLGAALAARTLRMREYAVPLAVLFLALAARPLLRRLPARFAPLAPLLGALLLLPQAATTLDLLSIERVHAGVFSGARGLLEQNGRAPILNLAESDYCMLRWEHPEVVCVQALSRYFLWPDRQLYAEVRELHERADTSPRTAALLASFHERGVRLVVTHSTHKLHTWAGEHPEALELAFQAPLGVGAIWRIVPARR
jgi:hypothetical protein